VSYLSKNVKLITPKEARDLGYVQMTEWEKEGFRIRIPIKHNGVIAHKVILWHRWLRSEYERVLKAGRKAMILKKGYDCVREYAIFIDEPLKNEEKYYIPGTSRVK